MPFLLAEILNFQGSTHLTDVGSFSQLYYSRRKGKQLSDDVLRNNAAAVHPKRRGISYGRDRF